MNVSPRSADEPTVQWLDRSAMVWVAFWLLIGVWTAVTLWRIADIGDTLTTSGGALNTAGEALNQVALVPVIGDRAGVLGQQVVTTSAEVTARGQQVKGQLHQLAVLLGAFLILVPTVPVVALYLPGRLARKREVAEIRTALSRDRDDPQLDRLLAARAVENLSLTKMRALGIGTQPGHAEVRALADAELQRLGVTRPAQPSA
jgi:hypothetical protein